MADTITLPKALLGGWRDIFSTLSTETHALTDGQRRVLQQSRVEIEALLSPVPALKPLPAAYAWLDTTPGLSRMLVEARALFGVTETPGPASTAQIMAWAKDVGLEKTYPNDGTAWCGLFAAVVAQRAGWDVVGGPLWARNWASFGRKVETKDAALGDVLVFSRDSGGHVGLYVGEDAGYFHVLGGNQSDAVTITRIAKGRLLAVRRPKWKTAQPAGVVKMHLTATGAISENEA